MAEVKAQKIKTKCLNVVMQIEILVETKAVFVSGPLLLCSESDLCDSLTWLITCSHLGESINKTLLNMFM